MCVVVVVVVLVLWFVCRCGHRKIDRQLDRQMRNQLGGGISRNAFRSCHCTLSAYRSSDPCQELESLENRLEDWESIVQPLQLVTIPWPVAIHSP